MEAIFTLPYSEYVVAEKLNRIFKKTASVYIPTSRQQKGIDLIINKNSTNIIARVQIKASRSYKEENKKYSNYLWFNNFEGRYKEGNADFYILFGLYPLPSFKKDVDSECYWRSVFLCFNEKEMFKFLKGAKTKREGKRDTFFGFGFDSAKKIYATRYEKETDVSGFLLENKIDALKTFLDK
jgi:hypothetical protein